MEGRSPYTSWQEDATFYFLAKRKTKLYINSQTQMKETKEIVSSILQKKNPPSNLRTFLAALSQPPRYGIWDIIQCHMPMGHI